MLLHNYMYQYLSYKCYKQIFTKSFFRVPKTGYIKMMDIWQIGSLILPFLEVVLHISVHSLKHKQKNNSLLEDEPVNFKLNKKNITLVKSIKNKESQIIEDEFDEGIKMLKVIKIFSTYVLTFCYILFIFAFFCIGLWFWIKIKYLCFDGTYDLFTIYHPVSMCFLVWYWYSIMRKIILLYGFFFRKANILWITLAILKEF